ncbi:MAG: hypothetical protein ACFFC9_15560 [Promethearchaeota archaeon]
MVLVMTTNYFPTDKSEVVGKKYIEITKKYPPDRSISKPILRVGVRVTPDGMKAISISEVKEDKFSEFMRLLYEQILLWSEIEGYRMDVEVFMSGTEAMPLVGLKMPEE